MSRLAGAGAFLLVASRALAAEYYVATTGSDSNPGTITAPFATLQKGSDVAVAGDTVWLRGGTYKMTAFDGASGVVISKSGQSDTKRIKFWAYDGEVPIFDFAQTRFSASNKFNGIYVTGSWLHFKGIEVANIPQPGTFTNSGLLTEKAGNNIFELLDIHHIGGPGLFINGGMGGNLILNCDSHDNYDASSAQGRGENADGFGVHYQSTGPSTVIRGCRAWWNSDDGYDLISQEVPVTIEDSWAMCNGYIQSGTAKGGNGNGFKAGSSKTGIRHLIKNCVAWKNTAAGFYANHSSGGNTWYNNTAFNNGTQYNMLASPPGDTSVTITLAGDLAHKMRNNVGFLDKNANMAGVDSASNTWDLKIAASISDFVDLSDAAIMAKRQPDGSPPQSFARLRAGSPLIDRGVDVGLPSVGAPDLGAYEYGAPTSSGMGGAGGPAGLGGAAGMPGAGGSDSGSSGSVLAGGGGAGAVGPGGMDVVVGQAGGTTGHADAQTPGDPAADAGCACSFASSSPGAGPLPLVAGLMAIGLAQRRRHRRPMGRVRGRLRSSRSSFS